MALLLLLPILTSWRRLVIILELRDQVVLVEVTRLGGADFWSVSFSLAGRQALPAMSQQHLLVRHHASWVIR